MKTIRTIALPSLWIACSLMAPAQEGAAPAEKEQAPSAKTLEHEHLKLFAGEWDVKVTMHLGPAPMTGTAVASEKLVAGGLYLLMLVSGESGGKGFEGRAITAYDRFAKEFVSVWVDSDTSKASFSRGTFDPKTRTMTMTGEMVTPVGPMKTRTITVVKEDGSRREDVFAKGADGSEKLMMEAVYVRRKDAAALKDAPVDQKALPQDLADQAGRWNVKLEMKQKLPAGDEPAGAMTATETARLICGGKWVWLELRAEADGVEHLGYAILGHDPESKKLTAVWCDSNGGSFDVAEGTSDGKTRAMEGTTYDRSGTKVKWFETSTWKDADHRAIVWKVAGSGTQPMIQIDATYERVK
jgi:hypothetical protein